MKSKKDKKDLIIRNSTAEFLIFSTQRQNQKESRCAMRMETFGSLKK